MYTLRNPVRDYAWGSRTVIAELTGRPAPTASTEAEMWLGAHPTAPSLILTPDGPVSLLSAIDADPAGQLGPSLHAEYQGRLPFLFKVLAAERNLSIQAHPTPAQARTGYAAEEARGVPRSSPLRSYPDPFAKPELFVAQSDCEILCGFRPAEQSARILAALELPQLASYVAALLAGPPGNGIREVVTTLLSLPDAKRGALVEAVVTRSARLADEGADGPDTVAFAWAARLGADYPADVGVVISLLLNLVRLRPDQGVFLGSGKPHAYLRGWGLEPQANSDNTLRGGLTHKHIDVPELLRTLDFEPCLPPILEATTLDDSHGEQAGEREWPTGAREFSLYCRDLDGSAALPSEGPQVILCLAGTVELRCGEVVLQLGRGDSAYAAASDPTVTATGTGRLVRVTAGRCTRYRP